MSGRHRKPPEPRMRLSFLPVLWRLLRRNTGLRAAPRGGEVFPTGPQKVYRPPKYVTTTAPMPLAKLVRPYSVNPERESHGTGQSPVGGHAMPPGAAFSEDNSQVRRRPGGAPLSALPPNPVLGPVSGRA